MNFAVLISHTIWKVYSRDNVFRFILQMVKTFNNIKFMKQLFLPICLLFICIFTSCNNTAEQETGTVYLGRLLNHMTSVDTFEEDLKMYGFDVQNKTRISNNEDIFICLRCLDSKGRQQDTTACVYYSVSSGQIDYVHYIVETKSEAKKLISVLSNDYFYQVNKTRDEYEDDYHGEFRSPGNSIVCVNTSSSYCFTLSRDKQIKKMRLSELESLCDNEFAFNSDLLNEHIYVYGRFNSLSINDNNTVTVWMEHEDIVPTSFICESYESDFDIHFEKLKNGDSMYLSGYVTGLKNGSIILSRVIVYPNTYDTTNNEVSEQALKETEVKSFVDDKGQPFTPSYSYVPTDAFVGHWKTDNKNAHVSEIFVSKNNSVKYKYYGYTEHGMWWSVYDKLIIGEWGSYSYTIDDSYNRLVLHESTYEEEKDIFYYKVD